MTLGAFPTWLPVGSDAAEPVDVFGLLPAGEEHLRRLVSAVWSADVDRATLERCRDRIDAMITGTTRPPAPDRPTAAQRAAADFAEQFVLDPHGCTDEQMHALQDHFTPPQLATLTTAIAVFDALARVRAVLARPQEGTA
jgi:alkylhydroperoxidase family enzyme